MVLCALPLPPPQQPGADASLRVSQNQGRALALGGFSVAGSHRAPPELPGGNVPAWDDSDGNVTWQLEPG